LIKPAEEEHKKAPGKRRKPGGEQNEKNPHIHKGILAVLQPLNHDL